MSKNKSKEDLKKDAIQENYTDKIKEIEDNKKQKLEELNDYRLEGGRFGDPSI